MSTADPLSSCRWIVFDVTGTLLAPDPPAAEVYCRIAQRYGCAIALPKVQERFRAALVRHFAAAIVSPDAPSAGLASLAGGPAKDAEPGDVAQREDAVEQARWRAIVADTLSELPVPQADEAFETLWEYFANPRHWRLVGGVAELVEGLLASGRSLAIGTNLDCRVHRLLDGHPPLHRIERRFLSSQIGHAKPDRRFFDHVARTLAVPPNQILMVGDDAENDVAGSRRAGWQAIAIDDLLATRSRQGTQRGTG